MRTLVRNSARATAAQALKPPNPNVSLNKRINQCANAEELEQVIAKEPTHALNSINCATAIYKLGRFVQHKPIHDYESFLYGKLMSISKDKTFAAQALTNVCQGVAIGKLEKQIPASILEQIFAMPMPNFKPIDVSTLAWSFATVNQQGVGLWLKQVADLLLESDVKVFPVRDVVTLLWSFAKLQHASFHQVFQHVFLKVQSRKLDLRTFTNQDLAMLAWSCTQLVVKDDDTLLARKMLRLVSDHIYQDNRTGLAVQDMSTLLWSFSVVHPQGKSTLQVFDRLERLLMKGDFRNNETTAHALANIMWSLATVKRENVPLLERVFNALLEKPAHRCTGQDASNALWSLAKLRHPPTRNFNSLKFDDSFSNQALLNTLWALAVLELRPAWFGDLIKAIIAKPSPFDFHVFTLLWSLACLDLLDDVMVREFLYKEKQACKCTCLEDAMQLQQFKLAWPRDVALPSMVADAAADIDSLLRQIPKPESSHAHLKIASLLQAKLPKHVLIVNECNMLPNLFGVAVDMYIPTKNLVIEVDGPDHYLLDGKSLLGSTRFKHKLITKQGLEIISIPVNTTPQWIRAQEDEYIQELANRIHPNTEKKRYECPICHKRFARLTHMNRHQSAVH